MKFLGLIASSVALITSLFVYSYSQRSLNEIRETNLAIENMKQQEEAENQKIDVFVVGKVSAEEQDHLLNYFLEKGFTTDEAKEVLSNISKN